MHVPRFIILSFLGLLLAGTLTATALLASGSEPELGDSIVVTPLSVPGSATEPSDSSSGSSSPDTSETPDTPDTPDTPGTLEPNTKNTSVPPEVSDSIAPGAVPVPLCVITAGSNDCHTEDNFADTNGADPNGAVPNDVDSSDDGTNADADDLDNADYYKYRYNNDGQNNRYKYKQYYDHH